MAITINGSGTITGVSAGGLPDGSVTADDLASTLDISGKTVTLPSDVGGITTGKVLQVVQSVDTTPTSVALNAGQQWNNNLSVSITPSSTSSKILVSYTVTVGCNTTNVYSTLYRGGSALNGSSDAGATGDANSNRQRVSTASDLADTSYDMTSQSFTYLDSPATTSAVTYSPKISHGSGGAKTIYFNRDQTYSDTVGYATGVCQITAMEIGA